MLQYGDFRPFWAVSSHKTGMDGHVLACPVPLGTKTHSELLVLPSGAYRMGLGALQTA